MRQTWKMARGYIKDAPPFGSEVKFRILKFEATITPLRCSLVKEGTVKILGRRCKMPRRYVL